MSKDFKYQNEEKKIFKIIITCKNDKEISLSFTGQSETNEIYSSNYQIDDLNEKFGKIKHFKKIHEFYELIIDNIEKKTLILKSPYKNVINSIWKTFPSEKEKKDTFTLISTRSINKNISLLFYSDYTKSKDIINKILSQLSIKISGNININAYSLITLKENWILDSIYFLLENYEDENKKLNDYFSIIESNKDVLEYRKLLILFDENNMIDSLMKIINKYYKDQIFIVIFTDKNIEKLNLEIESKINKLSEAKRSYFDINNIFIYKDSNTGYQKTIFPILKVYSYFNQLGDGFYKQLPDLGLNIEGLNEELKYLFYTHYFNILLCGLTGTGKSTFINKIMGEKKSFTLKSKSAGTYRNNFYIHKDYPIKIIDVCGFAEGREGKENLEKLSLIYKKDSTNILIDEPMNDVFSFYGDKRNNIHLLLYFTAYNGKYDILPGELPVMYEAKDKNIPIIFIVNKCADAIFTDEEEMEDLKADVEEARKKTDFEGYSTYCLNCINSKGFDTLLEGIFEYFKKDIIKTNDLNNIKNLSLSQEDFKNLYKDSFFFGDIQPKDVFLNDSLLNSIIDIKQLMVKLSGYYSGELGFFKSIGFFYKRIYNEYWRDSDTNFFPLLTDLVKKIYSNFGQEKTYDECNKFIKLKISQYFDIDLEELKKDKEKEEKEEVEIQDTNPGKKPYQFNIEKFEEDYINLGRLFWNSEKYYKLSEKIEEYSLKNNSKLEEKIFTINEENSIDSERILLLVKRDFGLDNSKRDANNKEKIFQRIFYISYTCNELISRLCGDINQKGFKYKSIYNFFYTVSLSYNNAINGFINIKNKMKDKEKELKKYLKEKKKVENYEDEEDAPLASNKEKD